MINQDKNAAVSALAEEIMKTVRANEAETRGKVKELIDDMADAAIEKAMDYIMDEFVLMLETRISSIVDDQLQKVITGDIDKDLRNWGVNYSHIRKSFVDHLGDEIAKAEISHLKQTLENERRWSR